MSIAPSPRSDTDPIVARDWSVILLATARFTSKTTSTWSPEKSTPITLPTSLPATRTGEPLFRPCTFGNSAFSVYRCHQKPFPPITRKIVAAATRMAAIVITPSFNSDHASERVRGITESSGQKLLQIRVVRALQLFGAAFKVNQAVLQHDELGFVDFLGRRRNDLDRVTRPLHGHTRRDIEGVAELVRHDD